VASDGIGGGVLIQQLPAHALPAAVGLTEPAPPSTERLTPTMLAPIRRVRTLGMVAAGLMTVTPPAPLFETIGPAIRSIPGFPTSTFNDEALLALHPQVFIMTSLTPSLLPTLTTLRIPVLWPPFLAKTLHPEDTQVSAILGGSG
jgi:ABC-type Fe3+-hydroxamate transport system substrate-binding protein